MNLWLASALAEVRDKLTVDQALEALELAREPNRRPQISQAGAGSGQPDRSNY